jgi:hypothetical protein
MNYDTHVSEQRAKQLGALRQGAHPKGTERFFADPETEDRLGAKCELAFADMFGFEVDAEARPDGDGGIDFTLTTHRRDIVIDVKGARIAHNLLIKEKDIDKCADIIVLGLVRDDVMFLGWEHKSIMQLMPVRDFGYGIKNYYRHHSELRPMWQLESLIKQVRK